MLILLVAAGILAYGVIETCINFSITGPIKLREGVVIFGSTLSAALLYGSTINFSPCYNLIATASSYAAVGFVLLALSRSSGYLTKVLHLFTGCVLGIAILNKFSAGLCTFFLIIIFIAVFGNIIRKQLLQIALILIGIVITIFFFVSIHMMTENVVDEFRSGMAVFKQVQTEPTSVRLFRYVHEFTSQLFWSGAFLVIPILWLSAVNKTRYVILIRNLAIIITLLLGCYHIKNAFPLVPSDLIWIGVQAEAIALVLALSLINTTLTWTKDIKTAVLIIGLIGLPYCVAIGTGNSIHTQVIISLAPWGTVIAVLAIPNRLKGYRNKMSMLICALFVSVIIVQVFLCSLSPYHLNSSVWKQHIPTKISTIGIVMTDKATHDYVVALMTATKEGSILKAQPFLGFYNMPGAAIVMETIPLFSPWISNVGQSELILAKVNPKLLQIAVIGIMLNPDSSMPTLPKQLSGFPKGYKKCGEAVYPDFPYRNQRIQMWVPIQ